MGNRPQRHQEDLFQEILAVHTVPVEQEKELVNLSRQQKFTHTQKHACMLEPNGAKQQPGITNRTQGCTGRKISRNSWIKATDPELPNKSFREPQKRKSCQRQRKIRHCPLRCTTVMAGSTTARRITVIQQFAGASPTLAGSGPAGLAALALQSLWRDCYICAPESKTNYKPRAIWAFLPDRRGRRSQNLSKQVAEVSEYKLISSVPRLQPHLNLQAANRAPFITSKSKAKNSCC